MKYLLIFCMMLSGCTDNHRFMGDIPKDGECWYFHEHEDPLGAKVIKVGKKEVLFKFISSTGIISKEFQHSTIDLFLESYEFKRDCPK